jgi:AAHS family 3-hydroxyphenylpropionic acid transporter
MADVAIEKASPTPPRRAAQTLFLCLLVALMEGFDLQVMGVAAPQVRKLLGLSPEQLGWTLSASLIGLAFGAVMGGWLADRFGRKPVLIGCVLAFGAFTFASAYSPNLAVLFATRFATGLGLGGAMPNMIALVAESVSKKRITTAVSIMFSGAPVGGIGLALLARVESVGWRELFMVGGALPIVIAVLLAFGLAETHAPERRGEARVNAWAAWFGGGIAASTLLLWVVFALTLFVLSIAISWLPTLAIDKGYPRAQAFVAPLLFNVGSLLGAGVISFACDRFGVRATMPFVYGGMALAVFALSLAQEIGEVLALSLACGFFIMGAQFALYAVAPRLYEVAVRGAGIGGAVGVGRIGAILGPIVAGQLIGAGAANEEVMARIAPVAIAAGIAFTILTFTAGDRLRSAKGRLDHGPGGGERAGDTVSP